MRKIERGGVSAAVLGLAGLAMVLGSCRDATVPLVGPVDIADRAESEVALEPFAPSFQQVPSSLGNCTPAGEVSGPLPLCVVSRTTTSTEIRITFEGLTNGTPVPTIGYARFPGWLALRSMKAGGTGLTHNEPSGVGSIFWYFASDSASLYPSTRDIVLDRPVHRARLHYTACLSQQCIPNPRRGLPQPVRLTEVTLSGFVTGGTSPVSVAAGPQNYGQGTPHPTLSLAFNRWDPLQVTSPNTAGGLVDNKITRLQISGYENYIGVDDIYLTIANFRPVSVPGGPYAANQGSPIAFNGSASFDPVDATGMPHPQGDAVTYHWDFGDGVGTSTSATPSYTYLLTGEYQATLTVTDPNGLSHSSSVPVTVGNVAPTISAPASVNTALGESVTLPITFTDPGSLDHPWTYEVDWGDGTVKSGSVNTWAATMSVPTADATHTYTQRGNYSIRITVTDKEGASSTRTIEVVMPNRPPVAVIGSGPTSGLEGEAYSFGSNGSSDPDGDPLTYTWTITRAGSPVATLNGPTATYAFEDDGIYVLTLTASDGALSHSAQQTVTIANVAPTAAFEAPETAIEGQALTLSLKNPFDPSPADVAAGFQYAFNCGEGFSTYGSSATVSCTPSAPGTLTVGGRIRDKDGGFTEYTATIAVAAANRPPTAVITAAPTTGTEGAILTFDASGSSDPDGDPLTFTWTFENVANPGHVETLTGAVVQHAFADNGVYTVTVTVRDNGPNGGLSAVQARTVTISNVAPTATFNAPAEGTEGEAFAISLTAPFDPSPVDVAAGFQYAFDCGNGFSAYSSSATVNCTPSAAGTLTVSGKIRDKDGGESTYTAQVEVERANTAPVAAITAPASAAEGSTVTLSGAGSSDPDGDALSFTWAIVDNANPSVVITLTGETVNHVFPDNGTYTVTLTVRDNGPNGGLTDVVQHTVSVTNVAPTATFNAPAGGTTGQAFTVSLTDPFDPSPADVAAGFQYAFDCGNGFSEWSSASTFSCTPSTPGTRIVRGQIRDKDGAVSEYAAQVVVERSNTAPVAVITAPASAAEGSTVTLSGAGSSDPDGDALSFTWQIVNHAAPGGVVTLTGETVSYAFPDNGTYTVILTVQDNGPNGGLSSVAQQTVSVTNVAPTATFNAPAGGTTGQAFTVSLTDPNDPSPVDQAAGFQYAFDCGNGYGSFSSNPSRNCTVAEPGVVTVRGQIRDKDGGTREYTRQVVVERANTAPVAVITAPASAAEGSTVTLSGAGSSDAEGDALSFTWQIINNANPGGAVTLTGETVSYAFPDNGTYIVILTVQDNGPNGGLSSVTQRTVSVTNVAPTATFVAPGTGTTGEAFTVSLINPTDPSPVDQAAGFQYAFDCGDGFSAWSSANTASCTLSTPGTRTVRGQIRDKDGGISEYTAQVVVERANTPPTVVLTAPSNAAEGSTVTLSGAGSSDAEGDALSFTWAIVDNAAPGNVTTLTGETVSHVFPDNGTYTVTLTVRDNGPNGGLSTVRQQTVSVTNVAPTATFNAPAGGTTGQAFTISLADPLDPSPADVAAGFQYAFDCGTGYGSFSANPSRSCTIANAGTVTVRGQIRDKDGGISEYSAQVAVQRANTAPIVVLTAPSSAAEGSTVTLSGAGSSDPDGDTLKFTWAIVNNAAPGNVVTLTGQTVSHVFPDNGTYTVTLTVRDNGPNGGLSTVKQQTVTVTNVAPSATFVAPATATAEESFTISLTNPSDPSPVDQAAGFQYAFDCGTGYGTFSSNPSRSCAIGSAGTVTVRAQIRDKDGGTRQYTSTVVVAPKPQPAFGAGALIRRDAMFNSGRITGSLQVMEPSNVTFNGGATVTGDIFVPGLPTVQVNGQPNFGGTVDGTGSANPNWHRVTVNGGVTLGKVVRRTDPRPLPTVNAPPMPTGNRSVALNRAGESPGSFATLRDLTLNSNVGAVAVPAGTYGNFTANNNSSFVLGVAGSTTPTVYNFQSINLNSNSSLQLAGPVIITVRNQVAFNGSVGRAGRPEWLTLRIANGGFTLNNSVIFDGYVEAPNGAIILNGNTRLTGGIVANTFTLNSNANLVLVPRN